MAALQKVRGVILDVDGTLLTLKRPISETYASVLQTYDIPCALEPLHVAIKHVWGEFQDDYLNAAHQHATDHHREEQVWKEFVRRVLVRAQVSLEQARVAAVVNSIYDAFSRADTRSIASGASSFLLSMNEKRIPVIAATNNDRRTIKVLDELGLSGSLAGIFVSGELGWKKPSPFFFEALERTLAIPRSQLLHVGNDPVLDVEAAHRIGMQALLYGVPQALSHIESVQSFDQLSQRVLANSNGH